VILQNEARILGGFLLAFFDIEIGKFDYLAAFDADDMVMMIGVIEFKYGATPLEVMADDKT
jgi:hypothetical protein